MRCLAESVERIALDTSLSGAVRIERDDVIELAKAYGLAHRGCDIANTVDTQFAIASGGWALTALTIVSLIDRHAEHEFGEGRAHVL